MSKPINEKIDAPFTLLAIGEAFIRLVSKLNTALRNLTFSDNFDAREVDVSFSGTSEIEIPNPFRDGRIPTRWLIVDVENGAGTLAPKRGTTDWTSEFLYLQNTSASAISGKILFLVN